MINERLNMLMDAIERFRFKTAKDGGAKTLYLGYLEISKGNGYMPCARSIHYLKAFVQYHPKVCQWIIRESNGSYFSLRPWGEEYLYLISSIAAYYFNLGKKIEGLHWAVEAVHLFEHFSPNLDRQVRKEILADMTASRMICTFPIEALQLKLIDFFLDWQSDHYRMYGQENYLNDN